MPHGQPRAGFEKVWATVPTPVVEALREFMRRNGYRNLHQATSAALVQWRDWWLDAVLNHSDLDPATHSATTGSRVQNHSGSRDEGV